MAVSGDPDRVVVVDRGTRLTTLELSQLSSGGAGVVWAAGVQHVAYVGTGGVLLPLLIFSSARAAIPFTPLNYRLSAEGLQQLIARLPAPLVVADPEYAELVAGAGKCVMTSEEFTKAARVGERVDESADPDDVAIVLFTSGTTSQPKAVELTHHNLTGYVTGTVEFGSAGANDAALVCVPPYHIAGIGAALSNLYAGRRIVYLCKFDPREWAQLVRDERVTTATVVPTMLDRIIAELEASPTDLPTLRTLAYGGSKVGLPLVRRTMALLPHVGLVNAYGLTETSSTIAVLTPEDHRTAHCATEEAVARRLGSVGRPVPGIEVQVRDVDGAVLPPGQMGELFVRGAQVSGRYTGLGSVLDAQGWFPTRDTAMLDDDGYLFIGGRSDDTIIRGGENIAPAEVEDVLVEHPDVHEVVVVGVDDPQWGQIIVAIVVPEPGAEPDAEELREFVRKTLRGSRTPDRVMFLDHLPTTATGKVLRREIVETLRTTAGMP
ncbi:AMP-dependent synthetase [Mycobacterium arosiense ATCC BAA-1401 = DSM 45069]|uniref:Long-chain-fatty-acid--CoA ligase FadD13 n=2 Tax=Mycobacterium arosiense TaxID=425468 RepID=A0A1W9ZQ52_MYCAI|nr:AMP-dependent synthetase [Mycobacterium arosiense ATCC BAA-1401 = DSM 45069]